MYSLNDLFLESRWCVIHGDNLAIMRLLPSASVDLVYMDPPFCTGTDFGAFDDRWKWTEESREAANDLPIRVCSSIGFFSNQLGHGAELAYLVHLAQRFIELERVAKSTTNIVIHVDERLAHYVRLLLDASLPRHKWSSSVVWRYRRWPAKAKRFQHMHDVLFHYAGQDATFNELRLDGVSESTKSTFGTKKQRVIVNGGQRKTSTTDEETEGPPLSDVWDLPIVAPSGHERQRGGRYPTQKSEALLDRIILALSNPGDVVLDPNAGSGTSGARAIKHGRKWIGIDSSQVAVDVTTRRLRAVTEAAS
jgi:site-specific DNA-methyltransferase (adenine-specific)